MDPSRSDYCPQLQSRLPEEAEEICLILWTLLQIQFELGLGDFEEAAAQIYREEYISVLKVFRKACKNSGGQVSMG